MLARTFPGLKKGMSRDEVKLLKEDVMNKQNFLNEAAVKCIVPCFKDFKVPTVAQRESNCMTNCTAKALETYIWFEYYKATEKPGLL